MVHFTQLRRQEFIARLNHFVHPSEEVADPSQLIGRDNKLVSLRDCFETNGAHAFVWGQRGVGKTSLVHSATAKYADATNLAAVIGCESSSTKDGLLDDIYRRVIKGGIVSLKDSAIKSKLSLFGLSIEGQSGSSREKFSIDSVNHASDFLATILPPDHSNGKCWIIIVDEFDQISNQDTIKFFTSLLKQISVDNLPVKFVFCGVAADLNELIGSHESVDRYIHAVNLEPLSHDEIRSLVRKIALNFDLEFTRGQEWRISQISCGYPHFAHLICKEIISEAYKLQYKERFIDSNLYKLGIQRAASTAAVRLQNAYEKATIKGSNRYTEVLWAAADGQHLEKKFPQILEDYDKIMDLLPGRDHLGDENKVRNYLNNLCKDTHGPALIRRRPGWYQFSDSMLRSYVRLIAHNSSVNLGDESFIR